ncbi:hypothetical protein J2W91_003514 [Paenibacillus amylolyticus]|uniref:Uncharacterized protein n=1 Tax=Paenibacillus amylolyticus TaxID=1451 RepID=A0AAP5LQ19_PAEAM|nr:hypothetical protein [Paenibacillus amylolyticus]
MVLSFFMWILSIEFLYYIENKIRIRVGFCLWTLLSTLDFSVHNELKGINNQYIIVI